MHRSIANLIGIPSLLYIAALLAPGQVHAHEQQAEVTITRADCARLVEHVPSADVAYQPGVDAYGRAVAPADLPGGLHNGTQFQVPDTLHIPIEVDLLDRFGFSAPPNR